MYRAFLLTLAVSFLWLTPFTSEAGWKAGIATRNITPEQKLWMAGYGNRTSPVQGKLQDLWIKAVFLEDETGNQAVIYSTDLLGIPRTIYDNVCTQLQQELGLSRAQVMLNSSHTHTGPVLRGALHDIYPLDENQLKLIEEYSLKLEAALVSIAKEAREKREPALLFAGEASTDFAVNRRNNKEAAVPKLREEGQELVGPVDHAVPVLAVKTATGELKAVIFGYACHNTVLSFNKWSGDYAGFAQYALEGRHPGITAMFYMGCGADQNPIPRRSVALAQKYGNMLADAVDQALESNLQSVPAKLETTHEFVEIDFNDRVNAELLKEWVENRKGYQQKWALRLQKELNEGKEFATSYSLPVQAWELGDQQLWLTVGGEVTVDYSLGFKKLFGKETWVAGYCNDVPAYIPSLRVLEEDKERRGYEGHTSMMVYGIPALRWADHIEDRIVGTMTKLINEVRPESE